MIDLDCFGPPEYSQSSRNYTCGFTNLVSVIQIYNLMVGHAPIDWEQPFIWNVQMSRVLIQYPWFDEKGDVWCN
jgi:hypothetical protein